MQGLAHADCCRAPPPCCRRKTPAAQPVTASKAKAQAPSAARGSASQCFAFNCIVCLQVLHSNSAPACCSKFSLNCCPAACRLTLMCIPSCLSCKHRPTNGRQVEIASGHPQHLRYTRLNARLCKTSKYRKDASFCSLLAGCGQSSVDCDIMQKPVYAVFALCCAGSLAVCSSYTVVL